MSTINLNEINLKESIDNENIIIDFNDSEIRILNYLSVRDKNDLIMMTLQNSYENGIYNTIKMDMYFKLYIIYLYTNIVFSTEDRQDEELLYDNLYKSGLIEEVLDAMNVDELEYLTTALVNMEEKMKNYKSSAKGVIYDLVEELEEKLKKSFEVLNTMSPELLSKLQGQMPVINSQNSQE